MEHLSEEPTQLAVAAAHQIAIRATPFGGQVDDRAVLVNRRYRLLDHRLIDQASQDRDITCPCREWRGGQQHRDDASGEASCESAMPGRR